MKKKLQKYPKYWTRLKKNAKIPPLKHKTRYKRIAKLPTPPPPLLRFSNASIARRSLLIKNLVTHKLIEKSELAFIHIHGTKTFFLFIFCTSKYNQDKTIRLWKYKDKKIDNFVWSPCFVVLLHIFHINFKGWVMLAACVLARCPSPHAFGIRWVGEPGTLLAHWPDNVLHLSCSKLHLCKLKQSFSTILNISINRQVFCLKIK